MFTFVGGDDVALLISYFKFMDRFYIFCPQIKSSYYEVKNEPLRRPKLLFELNFKYKRVKPAGTVKQVRIWSL